PSPSTGGGGGGGGGVTSVPVPLSATSVGEPSALWLNRNSADLAPAEVGANVTRTVQVAPAVRVTPVQSSAPLANWSASVPVSAAAPTSRSACPVFVTVTVCALPVPPTGWSP